ncbi:melanoma inhibitory activity protein 2-like [Cebus imitator]|uniref:melanoma inhibitory activity protein 2-like n=1 Tax=Cebus imitator TaxID=2715852 RepID=UPI001899A4AF|nr:melanoma inhibitory activity protein 2-like [Cebus imitator]
MSTAPPHTQWAPQWSAPVAACGFGFQTEGYLFSSVLYRPTSASDLVSMAPPAAGSSVELRATPQPWLGLLMEKLHRIVAALLECMISSSNGFPWELVIWAGVIGFCAIPVFLRRSFRSVRSQLYVGREKKLAVELCERIQEKCKLLEKISFVQKSYEGYERESSLKDVSVDKGAAEVQSLEAACEKLSKSISEMEEEILYLKKELKEEKYEHSRQHQLMVDISEMRQSLEDLSKSLKSQIAEAKMSLKMFQMNAEQLKMMVKDALDENSQLQESQKHLLQEAEVWKEQVSERTKQKIIFEDSKVHTEQVLNDKDEHSKTLTKHLRKKKDWAAMLGEDNMDDHNFKVEMNSESENGADLAEPPKGALKKLIHAAKLNASLKILGERNQIDNQLAQIEKKKKKELMGHIKHLQSAQASLQSENIHFECENQKLQQKLEVMTELHQETTMRLDKTLTVEANYQVERQEKLPKQDKKINYTSDQLEKYRKQAKHLEQGLERRILSYQEQILLSKKKAHDNWLAARMAEINLNGLRKENAKYRHKLTDTEIKVKILYKDPLVVDVPNTGFGREHYTYVTDMRQGTPFPPPPPGNLFGVSPHDIPPGNFPGPPHAHLQ